jgi:hypothetical protein
MTSQQFMKENGMARAPHPCYLPDFVPSDFDLVGYVKHYLKGQSFEAANDLCSAIEGLCNIDLGWGCSRMDGETPEMYGNQW